MEFLSKSDFKAVCDDHTLGVINQSDDDNMTRAENYAIEEVSSYLRMRYDIANAYAARGDKRNQQLVMITCDIALYHLVSWLPKRIGFEIREIRYNRAINWLKNVQNGKAVPDIPVKTNDKGEDIGVPISYGGLDKSTYHF